MHSSAKKTWPDQALPRVENRALLLNLLLSALLLALCVLLFYPVLEWAWHQVDRADRQYHMLVSVLFIALCAYRLFYEKHSLHFAEKNTLATLIVCAVSTAYLINQHYLQFNALSVALLLMFCFALFGHYVSFLAWRSCTLPLLLALLVLPFEGYLDIFLGFPMRLLSAEVAVTVLRAVGVATISSDTVLMIDNRAAIVDIDCSGIRGFWLGSVFFCAITWIERYRMNLRWLLIAVLAAGMLFIGNVFRIVVLVLLDLVFDHGELAQRLHESLGLISFTIALFCSWLLLRCWAVRTAVVTNPSQVLRDTKPAGVSVSATSVLLPVMLLVFVFLQAPQSGTGVETKFSQWDVELPSQYSRTPLNAIETQFFVDNGAAAFKLSSTVNHAGELYPASVLIVLSGHWKAQHVPEHCYVAQGYDIALAKTTKLSSANQVGGVPTRQLNLIKNSAGHSQSFVSDYWFQSPNKSTVNYSRRVLSQIINPDVPWAMVSVLWHDGVPDEARRELLLDIRELVTRTINHHG